MLNGQYPDLCTFPSDAAKRSLVIIGLPASGKSSFAKDLLAGRSHYEDIHHWLYYRAEHIREGNDCFGRFLGDLEAGKPWVIDSVEMCERSVRDRFTREYLADLPDVEWLFFENNAEQCRCNAQTIERRGEGHRAHRMREIDRVTSVYDIPADALVRPVYGSANAWVHRHAA